MTGPDDPYDEAVLLVLQERRVSTALIQTRLGLRYNAAARLVERMEAAGLVSAADPSGIRHILAGVPEIAR